MFYLTVQSCRNWTESPCKIDRVSERTRLTVKKRKGKDEETIVSESKRDRLRERENKKERERRGNKWESIKDRNDKDKWKTAQELESKWERESEKGAKYRMKKGGLWRREWHVDVSFALSLPSWPVACKVTAHQWMTTKQLPWLWKSNQVEKKDGQWAAGMCGRQSIFSSSTHPTCMIHSLCITSGGVSALCPTRPLNHPHSLWERTQQPFHSLLSAQEITQHPIKVL